MRGDEPRLYLTDDGESRVPHMRGDEPRNTHRSMMTITCSPHAWG